MNRLAYAKKSYLVTVWILICVLGRLIPHPANFTPITNLCFFASKQLSRWKAYLVTLLTLLVSDVILAYWQGHSIVSSWTFFTYTGFAAMIFFGTKLPKKSTLNTLGYILASSIGFWLWTNFGVWLCDAMYVHTIYGLSECYLSALPFLRNALCGDLLWFGVIFLGFARVAKWQTRWI